MNTKDIINRKLEAAKQQIETLQRKVNPTPVLERKTVNTIPAGVPEAGQDTNKIIPEIPGFIQGGKRMPKKMKEV
tara:strand:- start:2216 stop:2440 length:225 start_codon:yes stop_codon:yes gene_type:complete